MNRFNLTSIKEVFSYLTLPDHEIDDAYVLELAYQAYETMTERKRHAYDQRVAIVQVVNHKAKLPKGWRLIESVAYMFNQPSSSDIENLDSGLPPAIDPDYDYNADDIDRIQSQGIVNNFNLYSAWFTSEYYYNNFVLLRPMDKPHTTQYHCSWCPNLNATCDYVYNITKGGELTTNIENGYLCISYLSDPMDDCGELLVIDHPDVFNAMSSYVMSKIWENKIITDSGNKSMQMHMMYLDRWEKLAMKVKGIMNMHNMDHTSIAEYQERYLKITKNSSVWNNQTGIIR